MDLETSTHRPDPEEIIKGKTSDAASTELSKFRTGLSEHRTGLSEQRTVLSDLRSHLSNERTHLSYLRTGIALISFGVTLNRFSIYLLQNQMMSRYEGRAVLHDTKNVGIGMVILGSTLLIYSLFHFLKTARAIEEAKFKPAKWSLLFFTSAVIVIGTLTTTWMILG